MMKLHAKTLFCLTFIVGLLVALPAFGASGSTLEGGFKLIPALILIAMIVLFITIGFMNKAEGTSDYYAAGRSISSFGSGMAIASNWMSAASFLGMAAIMYGSGYHGLSYVVGWTGGYVLLLVLMASQVRRFGKYTATDFIGDRYYSNGMRLATAIIAICISFSYCVGQFGGIGIMFKWILGINYTWSVIIGASVVLTYTLVSGMLGVTKNQQIQYVILIIAFLIPAFVLTFKFDYFWLIPPIGYGQVVSDIVAGTTTPYISSLGHPMATVPTPEFAMPWDPATGKDFFQWMATCFALMIGTAGLPHVIQKFYVVPKPSDARWSVTWGLFFICILYWTAPLYSAFGKILSSNPEVGALAKDAIVVYTAQLGSVHPLIVGFLAAGAVAAAFSTVSGLLVAGSSAFSHDIYFGVFNPQATGEQQMRMVKLATVVMAIGVAGVSLLKLGLIAQLVAVAFSLAGCTMFPLFLVGIWWTRSNRAGGIASLTVGSTISLVVIAYFIAGKYGVSFPGKDFMNYWLNPWYFAWIAGPLAVLANVVVSLMTAPPPVEVQKHLAETVHGVK
ncbi:VC_2705 family sodium/solute symporter [Desulfogranum mediterraneum]|uniref:VC_2705 family sodium/solute symporter n=1 Tax=Desulfogranum mediterraneum TaxID=160661 RepID=UPI0004187B8A|nr:VC_2705 family sodium/solute symporter [Desulfogranum mediterraneum]